MNAKHTSIPLAYQMNKYNGEDWLLAVVEFGEVQAGEDTFESVTGYITTDHVHASDVQFGSPEADLRLWTAAPGLLQAARELLARLDQLDPLGLSTPMRQWVRETIAAATGEPTP